MSDITSVSTGTPRRIGLIQTKAARFGTFNSPTTGSILYVDPNHSDEQHHSPVMDRIEAKEAFMRGLIEDPADAKAVTEASGYVASDDISAVATERTAEHAEADADVSLQPSALDSRASTAWQDPERVNGGAEGYVDGIRIDENGADANDDDAGPAPAKRTAKAKDDAAK